MAVTSTNNLRLGSYGDDVLELQKKLNQTNYGYNLAEDGSFGEKTLAAVKDYQKRSGLDVDGIVGTNTWGALTKVNTPAATTPTQAATTTQAATPTTTQTTTQATTSKNSDFYYTPYQKSDAVAQAEALLQQQIAQKPGAYASSDAVAQAEALLQQQLSQKPGEYSSAYQAQLEDIIARINNREDFSYDVNEDALYQQLKEQYLAQGQLAMMDTMGQAASLTGGYGNSWAQGVGQQTYQGYMQQLTDQVPELHQLAYDKYKQEEASLYDQASLIAGMEQQDYGRYRDSLSDYYTELDRLTEDARYKSEQDYSRYQDSLSAYYTELDRLAEDARYQGEQDYGKWADKLNLDYGMYRDQVADKQWQAEFDEAKRQYDQAYALENGSSSSGSKGGSTSGNGDKGNTDGNYNNEGYSSNIVKQAQAKVGSSADGYWGPDSVARAKALGYDSLAAVVASYGLSDSKSYSSEDRNIAIENWVAKMLANANSSRFDPLDVIKGSSFLVSDAERAYAREVLQEYYN